MLRQVVADPTFAPRLRFILWLSDWHGELERYMVAPLPNSPFIRMTLPGSHENGYELCYHWDVSQDRLLAMWFDHMWLTVDSSR